MIPYYKLSPDWAKKNQVFAIIGPEGLVSQSLFSTLRQTYKDHQSRYISLSDKEDLENFKVLLSQSLLPEPEILFTRITAKLADKLPLLQSSDKIIVLYGLDKALKQKALFQIRTYHLKEPYKSKEIQNLASKLQLPLSKKAISWIALSHQNLEYLINNTLEKIKLTYPDQPLSDEKIKPLIYNYNNYPSYEIIDALKDKVSLQIFLSSQRPENWQPIFWTLLSTWRKLLLCQLDRSQLKTHFLWEASQKSALFILNNISIEKLTKQHETLLSLEKDIKGLSQEPFAPKLKHWLILTQQSLA